MIEVAALALCLQVKAALLEARWPEHVVPTMVAVAYAESRCRKEALHQTRREKSVGPLQINVRAHPWVSEKCARSYRCSARAALRIYRSQGIRAWSVYRSGRVANVNGGAQGAYHISAEWGDTQLAGQFGSGAAAYGSEPALDVLASMGEYPEPFPLPSARETAQARGSCGELCATMPVWQRPICQLQCAVKESIQPLAVAAVAVGLIVVGALALTR